MSSTASSPTPPPSTSVIGSWSVSLLSSPAGLAWTTSEGRWRPYRHLRALNRKLVDVAAGRCKRLMVFMPPRHGKSELVSRYFPAWYLGLFLERRIILASYEADFAATWGRKARNLLEEHGGLYGVAVSPESSAADRWDLVGHEGGMATAGVRGPITGKGADVAIIDDPVKNEQEAMSEVHRKAAWDWYLATLSTRLQNDGAIILVMTRWHEDDLAGRLIKAQAEGKDRWDIISFPAFAEPGDSLGRAEDEPLCPEMFPRKILEATRIRLGSFWWAALYQQRPAPAEGGIFKRHWWRHYHEPAAELARSMDEIIQSWDMAFKETRDSSYVVGQVWGRRGADRFLLDQVRDRMDFPATLVAVRALSAKWPQAGVKLVEDAANGPAVISTLKHEIPGLIAEPPRGSKEARAHAASPAIESGNVYLPDPALVPWVDDLLGELASFPTGTYTDQVDALTQALLRWGQSLPLDDATKTLIQEARIYAEE